MIEIRFFLFLTSSMFLVQFSCAQTDVYSENPSLKMKPYLSWEESNRISDPEEVYRVSMNGDSLKKLPKELLRFKNLTELNIANNKLKRLPKWIKRFDKLEIIYLGGNRDLQIQKITPALSKMKSLSHLWIGLNSGPLPKNSINRLSGLKYLMVTRNSHWDFYLLIEELKETDQIEQLIISFNELNTIPSNIFELNSLKILDISNNKITKSDYLKSKEILSDVQLIW